MSTIETLLASIHEHATADELRPTTHFIGQCFANRDTQTLAPFHDRIQRLRRVAAPGSWHRGFADGLSACLDDYVANIEAAQRMESLAREIEAQPLWREILTTLQGGRELNQVTIGSVLAARAAEVPTSKTAISLALEDLRDRELVEYVPTDGRRERVHALTRRGRALCVKLSLSGSEPLPEPSAEATAREAVLAKGTPHFIKDRAAAAPKPAHASGGGTRKISTRTPTRDP